MTQMKNGSRTARAPRATVAPQRPVEVMGPERAALASVPPSGAAGTSMGMSQSGQRAAARAPSRAEPGSREPTHDEIAAKAYELWRTRGGDADFNWHEAERILRGE